MNPKSIASSPSSRSRYSSVVRQSHGTPIRRDSSGIPSTRASIGMRYAPTRVGERRDREPAVAGDCGRDAVQRRRAQGGIPERLRVEVGVHVDEARRDHTAFGLDDPLRGRVDLTDRDDPTAGDTDVAMRRRGAGAVDNQPAPDHEVELGRAHGVHQRCPWA